MHLKPDEIRRVEEIYGSPLLERVSFEMGEREWIVLRKSQASGRAHDVTIFVFREDTLAVIAKHTYPPGVYRAPSGGVLPGEPMEEGIAREVMEETGLQVLLDRYLLRVAVDFTLRGEVVAWTTHVFTGRYRAGEIGARDRVEIREARWVPLAELASEVRKGLLASGSAGLGYRAWLHDRVMEALGRIS